MQSVQMHFLRCTPVGQERHCLADCPPFGDVARLFNEVYHVPELVPCASCGMRSLCVLCFWHDMVKRA